jgi:hypothetical protein
MEIFADRREDMVAGGGLGVGRSEASDEEVSWVACWTPVLFFPVYRGKFGTISGMGIRIAGCVSGTIL